MQIAWDCESNNYAFTSTRLPYMSADHLRVDKYYASEGKLTHIFFKAKASGEIKIDAEPIESGAAEIKPNPTVPPFQCVLQHLRLLNGTSLLDAIQDPNWKPSAKINKQGKEPKILVTLGMQNYSINAKTGTVESMSITVPSSKDNEEILNTTFEHYKSFSKTTFPTIMLTTTHIKEPKKDIFCKITFDTNSIKIDEPLHPTSFSSTIPMGYSVSDDIRGVRYLATGINEAKTEEIASKKLDELILDAKKQAE